MLETLSRIIPEQLDTAATKRNLRFVVFEGAAYSLMVGVGETYLAALVIAVGLGDHVAGLITTVPVMGGACLQLVSSWGVKRLNSNRRWVAFAALIQSLSAAVIALLVLADAVSVWTLFPIATLYWFGGLAAGPAWTAWVANVVPRNRRASFFGLRSKICQACILLGILLGGGLLRTPIDGVDVFALLFGFAAIFRLVSATTIALGAELPTWRPKRHATDGLISTARNLCPETKKLLRYLLAVQVAVFVSSPFFTPYMLNHLNLSYLQYTWLVSLGFVGKIIAMPWAGRIAMKHGAGRLLWAGGIGIAPMAGVWLISSSIVVLSVIQIAGGAAWAFYELATMLLFFEKINQQQQVAALSVYNVGNAAAMVLGSMVGGLLLQSMHFSTQGYLAVFLASSIARLVALIWMPRCGGRTRSSFVPMRMISVRPLSGGWLRPIALAAQPPIDDGSLVTLKPSRTAVTDGFIPSARNTDQ